MTQRPEKKSKVWLIILLIVFAMFLIAGGLAAFYFTYYIPNTRYEHAMSLYEEGQYAESIVEFKMLGNFKDSREKAIRVNRQRYEEAIELYETGQFEEAKKVFMENDDYKDSEEYIALCEEGMMDRDYKEEETLPVVIEDKAVEIPVEIPVEAPVVHTHIFEEEIIQDPACTDPGIIRKTCTECGYSEEEEIPPNGHIYEEVSVKKPTCTENGKKEKKCSICGEVADEIVVKATGHSTTTGTCTYCGHNFTQPVEFTGVATRQVDVIQASMGMVDNPDLEKFNLSKGRYNIDIETSPVSEDSGSLLLSLIGPDSAEVTYEDHGYVLKLNRAYFTKNDGFDGYYYIIGEVTVDGEYTLKLLGSGDDMNYYIRIAPAN